MLLPHRAGYAVASEPTSYVHVPFLHHTGNYSYIIIIMIQKLVLPKYPSLYALIFPPMFIKLYIIIIF